LVNRRGCVHVGGDAAGEIRASNAVVSGADGSVTVFVKQPSGTTDLVLDVNGYFQ